MFTNEIIVGLNPVAVTKSNYFKSLNFVFHEDMRSLCDIVTISSQSNICAMKILQKAWRKKMIIWYLPRSQIVNHRTYEKPFIETLCVLVLDQFFLVRIFPHSDQKKLRIWTFLDKNFNSNISPVNVIVERVFGILKVRWRGLLTILDAKECFKCVYRIFCFA